MRVDELRELSPEDLGVRLSEIKEEFFNLRFQNATGQLENHSQLGQAKRNIARIETVIRERQIGIQIVPDDTPKRRRFKSKNEDSEGGVRGGLVAPDEPPVQSQQTPLKTKDEMETVEETS